MTDPRDQSRRKFLAGAVVGLVALARASETLGSDEDSQQDGHLLYVGTYTDGTKSDGIYLLRFDQRSVKLRQVASVNAGANPSFLAIHRNRRVLYAVSELEKY